MSVVTDALARLDRIASDLELARRSIEKLSAPPPPKDLEGYPAYYFCARAELGVREVPGPKANARIQEYLRSTTLPDEMAGSDETPWCSAFTNWCVERVGLEGTNRANARSWMQWGFPLEHPRPGCVVVLWRESRESGKGHVGFFEAMDGSNILILGGNQGNAVSVRPYPRSRLLGWRWHDGEDPNG